MMILQLLKDLPLPTQAPTLQTVVGLAGHVLLVTWIAQWPVLMTWRLLPRSVARPATWLTGCVLAVLTVPAAWFMRGYIGDLSATLQVLLVVSLWRLVRPRSTPQPAAQSTRQSALRATPRPTRHRPRQTAHDPLAPWLLVFIAGFALYPSALGLIAFDTYGLGALAAPAHAWFAWLAAALAVWLWATDRGRWLAVGLVLGLVGFTLQMMESTNVWDYLVDPLLWVTAIVQCVRRLGRALRGTPLREPDSARA